MTISNNVVHSTKDASFHQHYGARRVRVAGPRVLRCYAPIHWQPLPHPRVRHTASPHLATPTRPSPLLTCRFGPPPPPGTDNVIINNVFAFGSSLWCNVSAPDGECDRSAVRNSQHPVSSHDAGVNSSYAFVRNIVLLGAADVPSAPWVANNTRVVRTLSPTLGVANFSYDSNVYWSNALTDPLASLQFGASGDAKTWDEWRAMGKDALGAVADPLFADAAHFNFSLDAGSPALARGFVPIDLSTVGVRDGAFINE